MSRIKTVTSDTATPVQKELLDAIESKLGIVPNFLRALAHSPDALTAFLGLYGISENGSLPALTRERIALVVAQQNSCDYCLSVHSAIAKKAGLSDTEIQANRSGSSEDEEAAAAVTFANALNTHLGDITQAEFDAVRAAGYTDSDIVEIITHVGMNILTNLIGKATRIDIDFPKVAVSDIAA